MERGIQEVVAVHFSIMKLLVLALPCFLGALAFPQQAAKPQLRLRLLVDKETYSLKERVIARAELTNLTSNTLCFPVPDLECDTTGTGAVVVSGEPVNENGEVDKFICHADSRGFTGAELDRQIRERWIKLAPNGVHVTSPREAKLILNQLGNWTLRASYHPPQGSFSAKYKTVLQTAAQKAGCDVPQSAAEAEPQTITVVAR